MRTSSVLVVVGVLLATVAGGVSGQVVRGVIVDEETAAPIQGAFIQLLDSAGAARAAVLSDDAGRFILTAPGEGRYTLRAERIGYANAYSDTLDVVADKTLMYHFAVPVQAVSLEGIEVTGSKRCNISTKEGAETSLLWNEARKALDVVAWMEVERGVPFQDAVWERTRDLVSLDLEKGKRDIVSGFGKSAWRSESAENLAEYGFVREADDGGIVYYALNAETLLSNAFLEGHCFRITKPHKGEEGLIGLSFEPLRKGGPPDIEGTLWIERKSSALRYLEFRYTRLLLETGVSNARFGGHVEFRRMANGAWVVGRWWVRMPEWGDPPLRRSIGSQLVRLGHSRDREARANGLRIREKGGEIVFMARPRSLEEGTAALNGMVWDSVRARPLAGATVFLADLGRAVRTDALGRYRMSDLPAGPHELGFFHPFTDSLRLETITRPVYLAAGQHNTADLAVPLDAGCRPSPGTGTIVGFVESAADGTPISGVVAMGKWRESRNSADSDPIEHTTWTDAQGRYLFCGVPIGETVKLEATVGRSVELSLDSPGIFSQSLVAGKPRS